MDQQYWTCAKSQAYLRWTEFKSAFYQDPQVILSLKSLRSSSLIGSQRDCLKHKSKAVSTCLKCFSGSLLTPTVKYKLQVVIYKVWHNLNLSWPSISALNSPSLSLCAATTLISSQFSELAISFPTFGLTPSSIWDALPLNLSNPTQFHFSAQISLLQKKASDVCWALWLMQPPTELLLTLCPNTPVISLVIVITACSYIADLRVDMFIAYTSNYNTSSMRLEVLFILFMALSSVHRIVTDPQ